MAISLADIKQSTMGAPRLVIYGVPGIGKTTLAAEADRPVFIQIEDGLGALDVPTFPRASRLSDVTEAISVLISDDHDYGTVIVDTIDALEPMIWDHVCVEANKKTIEDFAYGKGYIAARDAWRSLLQAFNALRDRGMMVVLLAHSTVVKFEAPDSDSYDRYQLRLDKRAEPLIVDWADAVLFANYETVTVATSDGKKRGTGKGVRRLHTCERPAWRAKNRYRMPEAIQIPDGRPDLGWAAIMDAITGTTSTPATN